MNQRLLVIIAVMLLAVGGAGLLLTGGEETPKFSTVERYTAQKTIKTGERLTAESFSKQTHQVEGQESVVSEPMPADLSHYQAVRDLEAGTLVTRQDIQQIPKETVSVQKDFFLYAFPVQPEEVSRLESLAKGEKVDVWLRYFVAQKEPMNSHYKLVNRQGQTVDKTMVKYVKVLSERRFFSLVKPLEGVGKVLNEKARLPFYNLEIENADMEKIQAVSHLGEWMVVSANSPLKVGQSRTLVPGMVTELRGRGGR
ncbi:hypothetical protein PMPD1_3533 [Paramixta manurensis]|uniref:Uncharacterized protein n=1 Tax=Paramixta manurensis TaxID=2740817 RepID=A0A6M8UKZ2_9GAMM|nr:hypothetical protein PMPD1_3533 [Erwiniaceae bacterium PD-1]